MVFDEPDHTPPEPTEPDSPNISLQNQMDSYERSIIADLLRSHQYNVRKND